jgi:hypothetical protein
MSAGGPRVDLTMARASGLNRRYRHIVFESPHAIWVSCVLVLAINALLFYPTRVWETDLNHAGIDSQRQLLGMLLLFVLVPMWMLSCFFVTQRHSLRLALQLEQAGSMDAKTSEAILATPRRQFALGFAGGLFYALAFNIPTRQINYIMAGDWNLIAIILGQTLLWVCVGVLLAVRLHIAGLFHDLGGRIGFSLFEPTPLHAFARVGMLDVVIVVGGMAIATVQSIDVQFRLENYLSATVVAVPASIVLLIRPMWAIHRRMKARKLRLLGEIRALTAAAPESTRLDDMRLLEDLLRRRDRVAGLRTWPLDIRIWRRLAFYILIPPLAWAGAALMEVFVENVLGL